MIYPVIPIRALPCPTTPSTRVALRAELGQALPRDLLKQLHVKSAGATCWWRASIRDPRAGHVGADPVRHPVDLDAAGLRAGLHGLQLHRAAARGGAPPRVRAAASRRGAGAGPAATRFRAASPRPSSRGGTSIITRSSVPTTAIRSAITCRRSETPAGSSCSMPRRRCSRSTFGAARRETVDLSRRAPAGDRDASGGCRSRAHLVVLGAHLVGIRRGGRRCAPTSCPVFLDFPDRVHAQPARPALRHRSRPIPRAGARWCAATGSGTSGSSIPTIHLEHHYFPGVPFYHLPALQRALTPFLRRGCTGHLRRSWGWMYGQLASHELASMEHRHRRFEAVSVRTLRIWHNSARWTSV